jgi:hypothetical protein
MPHTNIKTLLKSQFFYKIDCENDGPLYRTYILFCLNIKGHLWEENVNVKNYGNTLA